MDRPKLVGIKMVTLIKKRKDLTYQQFKDYWLTEHNKIEREIIDKGKRNRIKACFMEAIVKQGQVFKEREDLPFDAWVEIHYNNIEDMMASQFPEITARLRKDEKNFIDPEPRTVYIIEEYLMAEKEPR